MTIWLKRITCVLGIVVLCGLRSVASAQVRLTGAGVFPTTDGGNWVGLHLWNTEPDGFYWNAFLTEGGPDGAFVNGPANDQIRPDLPLMPGTYTFGIFGERPLPNTGYDTGHAGLNLYLDGSATPSVSVFAATDGDAAVLANAGSVSGPNGGSLAGAGTATWSDGILNVEVVAFRWDANPAVAIDRVNGFDAVDPLGAPDLYGQVTLTVTAVPEPGGALALLAGAMLVLRLRRA